MIRTQIRSGIWRGGNSIRYRQNGAVLAITLLILVVVTVLGVSSMGSSSLQLFLARNTQLKQISFQNSESTVLTGEIAWSDAVDACLTDLANCTLDFTPAMIDNPLVPGMIAEVDAFLSGTSDRVVDVSDYKGKYIVEYLGWLPVPGEDDKIITHYRVSGRAFGPNDKALTRVQTIYRKCMKTDGSPCPT